MAENADRKADNTYIMRISLLTRHTPHTTHPSITMSGAGKFDISTTLNGGLRIKAEDEQGADTIEVLGARVLFKSPGGDPLDWDQDGEPNPDDYLELICAADTDPRRCEGSLLESAISGECSGTNLVFEGWVIDADGNESDHTENFEENGAIAPAG